MPQDIALSACRVPAECGLARDCPRPEELRNARYAAQYDWDTLFYDVYRAERQVVFQGPPLFSFLDRLRESSPFDRAFAGLFPKARHVSTKKRGEIWLRSDAAHFTLDGALGRHEIAVQPDGAELFAGRRVLTTLSKDNDPEWIEDWIRFYTRIHGAEAVLLYDNASSAYHWRTLQERLRARFPDIRIVVVSWPFPYGPSGGPAGAVNGVEAPWDSDFCQTGMLQHARFRFLRRARSVLNLDIDELVLSDRGRSIFAATEASRSGFVKFEGFWISATTPLALCAAGARHAEFTWRDGLDPTVCPAKWCLVPARTHARRHSWSVHNLFGSRHNAHISREFAFRHMRAISKGWKERRWDAVDHDPARFTRDAALARAFEDSGMTGRDIAPPP